MALIKIGYGKPKDFHKYKANDSDDYRIDYLTVDKSTKGPVCKLSKSNTASAFSLGSVARITFFELSLEAFLAI